MTTLSKEDVVRMADECVFDIEPSDEYHPENEVIDSGNRWITDKMMAFATLARADLVAENERLTSELSKHQAIPQYKEARKAEVAVLREQLTEAQAQNDRLKSIIEKQSDCEGEFCGKCYEQGLSESSAELSAAQAKIDSLMLEYCPDEMTPEQIENWGKHQKAVGDQTNLPLQLSP